MDTGRLTRAIFARKNTSMSKRTATAAVLLAMLAVPATAQQAERIQNPVAEFVGLDKITGQTTPFDVYIDETVQFGALQITPRVCNTSPATDQSRTTTFVEVQEVTLNRDVRPLFTGWMFADDPGLSALDHAVYDVWLNACKTESKVPAPQG